MRERTHAEPLGRAHLADPRWTCVLGRCRRACVGGAILRVAGAAERGGDLDDPVTLQHAPRRRAAAGRCAARARHRDHDDAQGEGARVRHRRAARARARAAPRRAASAAVARARDGRRTRRRHHGSGSVRERLPTGSGWRTSCGARNESATRPNAPGSCTSPRRAHASGYTSSGSSPMDTEAPAASSLLAHLEPIVAATPREGAAATRAEIERQGARADAASARGPGGAEAHRQSTSDSAGSATGVRLGRPAAAHVGTVVHRYLQRIAEQGLALWSAQRLVAEPSRRSRASSSCSASSRPNARNATERVVAALSARARRPARPLGARTARGSARGAPADAARRSCARACPPRPHLRRGWSALDRGFQDEPARRRELERISRLRGRALCATARALRARRRGDRSAADRARLVLSVARRAALLAGSRYSEPVRLSRRRPSASGSAVMILSPSTSDSGAPTRGSTSASST